MAKRIDKKSDDFDQWLGGASTTNSGRAQSDGWPPEAIAEINEVLKRNDAGTANVAMPAMSKRLREKYGAVASDTGLFNYAVKLGRKGWRQK
jgi:hypothetical protein